MRKKKTVEKAALVFFLLLPSLSILFTDRKLQERNIFRNGFQFRSKWFQYPERFHYLIEKVFRPLFMMISFSGGMKSLQTFFFESFGDE